MGCRISLKIYFLHSHLDFFPPKLGAMIDEHAERFPKDISKMKSNYQGKWNCSLRRLKTWLLSTMKEILTCFFHFMDAQNLVAEHYERG